MVAILSPHVLPDIRLTADEYLQADLPEGQRYELVDGVIQMTPVPSPPHDESLHALLEALYAYHRGQRGLIKHLSTRAAVPIPDTANVREPDLAAYREWETVGQEWDVWKTITPFWVAEVVSPTQRARDYEDKRRDYWLAGIEEYWIIDGQAQRVTVLVRGRKDWTETVFRPGEDARSISLPGFTVPVTRLIGAVE